MPSTPASTRPRAASALLCSLFGSVALLTACGGGSGDSSPAVVPASPPPPATVSQAVSVIDGAIKGAVVCLDKNGNGLCDADETQGVTAADGSVTLTIPAADAGKYPVLALVGTDAVDAVNGPVTTAFSLSAPADKPALVTPLTTLVVAQVAASGSTSAEAEKALQDQLGISVSLFADFSKSSDAASATAASVARLVVLTSQKQNSDLQGATDASGKALDKTDLDKAAKASLLSVLPTLVASVSDPAVSGPGISAADKEAALKTAAAKLSAEAGLTKASVAVVVAVAKLPATPEGSAAPQAGSSLRWFSFTDSGNYSFRQFKATAAQNTVVDGKRQFSEYREQTVSSGGAVTLYRQWGEGLNNWPRLQVFWTGSEWFDCPTDFVSQATPWDDKGQSDSLYCKAVKSHNKRAERDIAGLAMVDIVKEIRAYPLYDGAGKFSQWGPDPVANATALAGSFPAGSKLYYQLGTDTNPDTYNTDRGAVFEAFSAGISGGVATECNKLTPTNVVTFLIPTSTLEQVVSSSSGTPCVFAASVGTTGPRNESWGLSTIGIGDVTDTYTSATGYYKSGVKSLRVSFAAGKVVNYWLCLRRKSDNSTRNCDPAGSGSYSIETQRDARVLRLAGVPAVASSLGYSRSMVERGGVVYFGFRSNLTVSNQLRLNQQATAALFSALGIPAPQAAPVKMTATLLVNSYLNVGGTGTVNRAALATMENDPAGLVGAWAIGSATSPLAQVVFFFSDGQYVLADPVGDRDISRCGDPGMELGTYAFDAGKGQLNFLTNVKDTNGCAGAHDTTDNSFSHPPVTLAADGKTAIITVSASGDTRTLYRLTH